MVDDKITVVDTILDQIGAEQERVLVFNKIDLVTPEKKLELLSIGHAHDYKDVYFVSAHDGTGKEALIQMMVDKTQWR
jgi:50S ribosomal subunit-associated GTPase HflX